MPADYLAAGDPVIADHLSAEDPVPADYVAAGDPVIADHLSAEDSVSADHVAAEGPERKWSVILKYRKNIRKEWI